MTIRRSMVLHARCAWTKIDGNNLRCCRQINWIIKSDFVIDLVLKRLFLNESEQERRPCHFKRSWLRRRTRPFFSCRPSTFCGFVRCQPEAYLVQVVLT